MHMSVTYRNAFSLKVTCGQKACCRSNKRHAESQDPTSLPTLLPHGLLPSTLFGRLEKLSSGFFIPLEGHPTTQQLQGISLLFADLIDKKAPSPNTTINRDNKPLVSPALPTKASTL